MTRSWPLASEPRQTHSQMERSVPPGWHSQDPANVQLGTEHDGTFGRKSRTSLQDSRENKVPAHGLPGTSVKKRHRLGVYTTDSPPGSGGQTSKVKVALPSGSLGRALPCLFRLPVGAGDPGRAGAARWSRPAFPQPALCPFCCLPVGTPVTVLGPPPPRTTSSSNIRQGPFPVRCRSEAPGESGSGGPSHPPSSGHGSRGARQPLRQQLSVEPGAGRLALHTNGQC